ncbi:hypothetical protein H2200_004747 [Cladophialophora chaetospira]|uniref:Uncharacterized protein n=1 Tax=Cladophialophora chaetospira TaxID=386627 RepID=A0AA38XDP0_9EURO|nr:hypothetical protein H2200_004747 [Cladophialophora chaetospira]
MQESESAGENSIRTVSSAILERSFQAPLMLDSRRLKDLIAAKRASAEHGIWDLREDPGSFQTAILTQAEHRPEMLPDISGRVDLGLSIENLLNQALPHVIDRAYSYLLRWEKLFKCAELLSSGTWGPFKALDPLKPLPISLEQALLGMHKSAIDLIHDVREELKYAFTTSPQMKAGYVRARTSNGNELLRISSTHGTATEDIFMQIFDVILDDESDVPHTDLIILLDEIQRMIDSDPKVKSRFSAYVYNLFSDLALAAYIVYELDHFYPWASKFATEASRNTGLEDQEHQIDEAAECSGIDAYEAYFRGVDDTSELRRDLTTVRYALSRPFQKTMAEQAEVCKSLGNASPWDYATIIRLQQTRVDVVDVGVLPLKLQSKQRRHSSAADRRRSLEIAIEEPLRYPVDRGHTKANVAAMRRAELTLDTIWKRIDDVFQVICEGCSLHQIFLKYATMPREIYRTPLWTDRTQSVPVPLPIIADNGGLGAATVQVEPEILPRRPTVPAPRLKVKKQGTPNATLANASARPQDIPDIAGSDPARDTPLPLFELKARQLKIFRTMFYTASPGDEEHGSIDSKDFRQAMTKIGFSAEKLWGSVWQFTPGEDVSTTEGVRRGFNIHEPHPSSEIPYRMARCWGRRLNRIYGWTEETFVEDK